MAAQRLAAAAAPEAVAPDATLALPVEELQLPVRAFNSLRREGIHTVGDLSARTEAQLRSITNLGPQSIKEIKQKLAERGLGLAGAPAGAGAPAPEAGGGAVKAGTAGTAAGAASRAGATAGAGEATGPQTGITGAAPAGGPSVRGVTRMPPRAARPPDEDAIDLLSVAGFPVLKRALPVVGVIVAALLLVLGARRRRRRRAAHASGS